MSTAERAYFRLVAANPIPDPEKYMERAVDLDAALRDLDEVMRHTRTHEGDVTDQIPLRRRQWRVATAAFLTVLIIGVLLSVVTQRDRGDVATGTPLGVVEVFFERWNSGNVDTAMALTDPDISILGGARGATDLRGLIEWSIPFDGTMETDCRSGGTPALVSCDWAFVTAGTEALGITGGGTLFTVVDGVITALTSPSYAELERQLSSFAQTEDPDGYAEACSPDGTSPMSSFGFPFNEKCGRFLANLEPAFVASLNS